MKSCAVPALRFYTPVTCPRGQQCQLALLPCNDVLLRCHSPGSHWYYYLMESPHGWLINRDTISNMEVTPEGSLAVRDPLPIHTGLYHRWDENETQVTRYEIDFQDATALHITHKSLGEKPLQNASLQTDGSQLVFTRWEPWQDCNRCGKLKHLGYCYIQESLKEPMPCRLYPGDTKALFSRLRPELQVEACHVPCKHSSGLKGNYKIFNNFELDEELEFAQVACPLASTYRPISWETSNISLTWQDQLSGRLRDASLDFTTGGGRLHIFRPAIYRCFVGQEFIAQYNPTPSDRALDPQRRDSKVLASREKADSVLNRLKALLSVGATLVLWGLVFKLLCSVRGKSSSQPLLVK
ncbi:protein FAM187B-like [Ctenodactylus gundi]